MTITRKYILITGSTGFVCRHLVDKLLDSSGFNIILTYREKKGDYKKNNRLFFEKVDLLKPNDLESIFNKYKPQHVVHLAAMARLSDGENNPKETLQANYFSTVKIAELSVTHDVKSLIFTSSNLAQDVVSVVGATKLLSEQYFQKTDTKNTKCSILRMPNVIDSNGSVTLIFKKQIENNNPITITHPDMSRMFVSGSHAADLLYHLILNGVNKGIYVSYDKPVKIIDLAKQLINNSGKKIDIEFIGMKPGEKLSEKSFEKSEVIKSGFAGLGIITDYKYDKKLVNQAIEILGKKDIPLFVDDFN